MKAHSIKAALRAGALCLATAAAFGTTLATAQEAGAADAAPVEGFADVLRDRLGPDAVFLSTNALVMLDAAGLELDAFQWLARPLVVFADSPFDPRFLQQMEYIEDRWQDLADRDVVVIVDTDPAADTAVREELRPRGFDLVLIGKDGFKYLRKPLPWDVREISRSIDKMPLRQQELKDSRGR